jgi:hypothetical protein
LKMQTTRLKGSSMRAPAFGGRLSKHYDNALSLHDRRPFPNTPREIAEPAAQVWDDDFRIEVADDGIHVYNRRGHHISMQPRRATRCGLNHRPISAGSRTGEAS